MARFIISPAAAEDIESILAWTDEQLGEQARLRYEALLIQAIIDVAEKPDRAGSRDRVEIAISVRTYHLSYSRKRVANKMGRVKKPRHLLLYRTRRDDDVEIARVLHDSMDLERHLPDEYRTPSTREDDL